MSPASEQGSARFRLDPWMPWILFAGFLALYLWRLSLMALWDNDETTYAEIAREIWVTGDWVTMHFRGLEWFCHPPLYYWLVALLDRVLGCTELAARLPAAVAGAGVVGVVYTWGRRMLTPRAALIGVLSLGTSFQFYTESRMALLDTLLYLFSFLAVLAMWDGLQGRPGGYRWMFVWSGLACLSKGPFGLLFPLLLGLPFLLLTHRLNKIRRIPWGWMLAALLIGGTWYGVEIHRHGRPFFDTVLIYFAVKRMTIRVQGQGAPYWLYFAITAAGLFPWSFFLPPALLALARFFRRERSEVAAFLLVSIGVPFVFFTIAETKLPNYIVFAYPGMALAIGWFVDTVLTRGETGRLLLPTALTATVACLFVVGMQRVEPQNLQYASAFPTGETVCGVLAVFLIAATVLCVRPTRYGPIPAMALGMAVFLVSVSTFIAPIAEAFRPIKTLGMEARARLQPQDVLTMRGLPGEYGLTFYAQHIVTPASSLTDLRRVLNSQGKVLAVISASTLASLSGPGRPPLHSIATSGNAVLIVNEPVTSSR